MYQVGRYLVVASVCLSMGCIAEDSDGDEHVFDTDVIVVDFDGDGIDDDVEDANQNGIVDEGETDPREFDTDGDTYGDGLELEYGTDPTDFDDRIYEGFWPYNPNKDEIEGIRMSNPLAVGDVFPRYIQKDQFKERVDLYDFAGHGKMIILDFCTQWCGPCNSFAWFLDGSPDTVFTYTKLREAINQGDLYFITVLLENNSNNAPTIATSSSWYELYPNEHIPVFADKHLQLENYAHGWYPSFILLNDDMSVEMMETDSFQVIDYVESIL